MSYPLVNIQKTMENRRFIAGYTKNYGTYPCLMGKLSKSTNFRLGHGFKFANNSYVSLRVSHGIDEQSNNIRTGYDNI
jgi:hypothetical protein